MSVARLAATAATLAVTAAFASEAEARLPIQDTISSDYPVIPLTEEPQALTEDPMGTSINDMCKAYDAYLTHAGTPVKMEAEWAPDGTVIVVPHTTYLAETLITVSQLPEDGGRRVEIVWPPLEGVEASGGIHSIPLPYDESGYTSFEFEGIGARGQNGEEIPCHASLAEGNNGEEVELTCSPLQTAPARLVINSDTVTLTAAFTSYVTSDYAVEIECNWLVEQPDTGGQQTVPSPSPAIR